MEASNVPAPTATTLAERIEEAVHAQHAAHGYLDDEGELDKQEIEDKVYDLVLGAVVTKRAERGKLAITRRNLVATVYPNLPGPDEFDEQDDPALASRVYAKIDTLIWKMVNVNAGDAIQARLNSDTGLVLCRTLATPDKVWAVYTTTDLACVLVDFSKPQKDGISKAAARYANNLAMAVERMPEHGKRFMRELNDGMKAALGTGSAILGPVVEAAEADEQDDDE